MINGISLVATVKNECESLDIWLAGLEAQTRPPEEAIIVDGGSTDGTWERLQEWQPRFEVRTLRIDGANISKGRNAAIEVARHEIIAVTDAGTVATSNWLQQLVGPFETTDADVVGGFFEPVLDGVWSRSLAATTLPDPCEIRSESFQPSSRSLAFRRSWWEAGVRYPEWLDYCEDLVWDLAMRRAGARFVACTEARVAFAVRPNLKSFLRQYFLYARGDGKAGLFARRHALRYSTYVAAAIIVGRRKPVELASLTALGLAYMRMPIARLVSRDMARGVSVFETVRTIPLTVVLRAMGDIAKMVGYPAGLHWRIRTHGAADWRTRWSRVSPSGILLRPATLSKGTQPQSWLLGDESPQDSTSPTAYEAQSRLDEQGLLRFHRFGDPERHRH